MQKKTLLSLLAVPAALSAGASASIGDLAVGNTNEGNMPQTYAPQAEAMTPAEAYEAAYKSAETYLHDDALEAQYGEWQKEGLTEIEKIKKEFDEIVAPTDEQFEDATAKIQAVEAKYRTLIETQETNYKAATDYITYLVGDNENPGLLKSLERNQTGIKKDISDIKTLISKMNSALAADRKVNEVKDLASYNSAIAKAVFDLQTRVSHYDTTLEEAKKLQKQLDEIQMMPGYFELSQQFSTEAENIQKEINRIKDENDGSGIPAFDIDDTEEAIKALKEKVEPASAAYSAIMEDLKELDDAIAEAQKAVTEKAEEMNVEGIDAATYGNADFATLQTAVNNLRNELNALIPDPEDNDPTSDSLIDDLKALAQKVDAANTDNGVKGDIANTRYDLFKGLTVAYLKNVTEKYNELADNVDLIINYPGAQEVKAQLDAVYSFMNNGYDDGIKGLNERVPGASIKDQNAYGRLESFNTKIKAVEEKLKPIEPEYAKVLNNHNNYDSLNELGEKVQTAIDGAIAAMNEAAYEGAKPHYQTLIDGPQKDLADTLKAILDDYQDIKVDDAAKAEYEKKLNEIRNAANDAKKKIKINEDAHDNQLRAAETTLNTYDRAEAYYNTLLAQDPAKAAEYSKQLEEIKKALLELNNQVADSYVEGNSAADETAKNYCKQYEDIQKSLNELQGQFMDDIRLATMKANYETLRASAWGVDYDNAWRTYKTACDTYDEYLFAMTNEGYRKYVTDKEGNLVVDNAVLFDYSTEINQLSQQLYAFIDNTWSAEKDEDVKVITEEDLLPFINQLNEISRRIYRQQTAMMEQANSDAVAYFNQEFNAVKDLREKINEDLEDHGIDAGNRTKALAALDAAIKDAEMRQTSMLGTQPHLKMSEIADILDKADDLAENFDYAKVALYQWKDGFKEFKANMNSLEERLNGPDCEFDPNLDEAKAALADIATEANELDDKASKSKTLYDDLKEELGKLKDLLSDARVVVGNSANASAIQKNKDEKYKEQIENIIPALKENFDTLKTYVDGLAVEYTAAEQMQAVADALKAYEDAVEANKTNIPGATSTLNRLKNAFNSAIDATYRKVFKTEKEMLGGTNGLTGLLGEVLVAFNNINKDEFDKFFEGEESYMELNYELDNYVNEFFGTGKYANPGLNTIKGSHEDLINAEDRLSSLLVKLRAAYKNAHPEAAADDPYTYNPVPEILKQLGAQYDTVAAAIEEAKAELGECMDSVKTEFDGVYDELKAELDAVKADWEDDNDAVMVRKENYTVAMDALAAAIESKAAEVAAAEKKAQEEKAKQEASDARYTVLKADLDATKAAFEDFKQLIANAEVAAEFIESERYELLCSSIEGDFEEWSNWLEAEKEAYALTATSVWDRAAQIKKNIAAYVADVNTEESRYQIQLATDIVTEVNNAIKGGSHVDQDELEKAIDSLTSRLNTLSPNADTQKSAEVCAEAKQIAAEAATLQAEVEEKAYTAGDLDFDGTLNAVDMLALLDMVANDAEYDKDDTTSRAADLNTDARINLSDVVVLANMLKDPENKAIRSMMRLAAPVAGANSIEASLVSEENGVRTYAINVANTAAFVGGQFDLQLPGGMDIFELNLGQRTEGMDLSHTILPDGRNRIIVFSQQLDAMRGNEGAVITFKTFADNVNICNALFVDATSAGYELGASNTTGINGIDTEKSGARKVYDTAGRMINKVQRGINIIVNSNGKVSKEIRK